LLETIKSLYDQKLRTTRLLLSSSSSSSTQKCRQQLDWPFELGTMRDGMPMLGKNDVSQPCNVLERIPPFKYRYQLHNTYHPKLILITTPNLTE
jgi:hypothetical protein